MATEPVTEVAPAKINLCLHVTGRRANGYHLLDSLVVFAAVGDQVTAREGQGLTLAIAGPEAGALCPEPDNLVTRAARMMQVRNVALSLWKTLPVASGIGGGSADAAAALRVLARLTGLPMPEPEAVLALGADVPVCLKGLPTRMQGVGDVLAPLPGLPPLWVVLVNPRIQVPTPRVFAALGSRKNPPVPDLPPVSRHSARALAEWLAAETRNDLIGPALSVAPVLAEVQTAIAAATGCLLARMSGSGGTHFGLFASATAAEGARAALAAAHRDWWVAAAPVLPA